MSGVRKEGDEYLVRESRYLDRWSLEGKVDSVIDYIKEQAKDLRDPAIDIHVYEGYYGDGPDVEITMAGDRLATQDEIGKYEKRQAKAAERRAKEKKEKAAAAAEKRKATIARKKQEQLQRDALRRAASLLAGTPEGDTYAQALRELEESHKLS